MVLAGKAGIAQNIIMTFTATGEATRIDSISATNLRSSQSITFPGSGTLILNRITATESIPEHSGITGIYPNPCPGRTTLAAEIMNPGLVTLRIRNITGQDVASLTRLLEKGSHQFVLSLQESGIYLVTLITPEGSKGYKVICTGAGSLGNGVIHTGSGVNNIKDGTGMKALETGYNLGFKAGDVILYRCYSGVKVTVLADKPSESGNYVVTFAGCTDLSGKNYSVVKIGIQVWMAENLAYLPAVRPAAQGSDIWPYHYVYGYEGTVPSSAREHQNFSTYGVLYNWAAAMAGSTSSNAVPSGVKGICPTGWHLPSNAEWTILSDFIGESAGAKIKETGTEHWFSPNDAATNETGFTARPSGIRDNDNARFTGLGSNAYFWTSTEGSTSFAWYRVLDMNNDNLTRLGIYKANGFSVRCVKD